MPTIAELGQKVKAKYPGAYDDLSDEDLGRKVQQKYPGAYDDFVEPPAVPAPPASAMQITPGGQGQIRAPMGPVLRGAPDILTGIFAGSLEAPTAAKREDVVGTLAGQGVGTLAGRAALPLLTPLLGPYAPLVRGGIEGTSALLGLLGARRLTGRPDPTALETALTVAPPIALRGAMETAPQIAQETLPNTRVGKFAVQENVRAERTRLQRNYEQAQQLHREQMAPIQAEAEALQGQWKDAQKMQNALRKAMQDKQRQLKQTATAAKTENVDRVRELVRQVPAPTDAQVTQAYKVVDSFEIELPMDTVRATQKALLQEEALLKKFPALQSRPIQGIAATPAPPEAPPSLLVDQFGRPLPGNVTPQTLNFQELRAALSRTGQRISSLRKSTDPTAREQLRAYTQVRASLEETLDMAAASEAIPQEARAALTFANGLYKQARTLEELSSGVEQVIRTRPDGRLEFNAGALLDYLRKNKDGQQLAKRLGEIDVLPSLEKHLQQMADATRQPPPLVLPRAPMQPGRDILGKAREVLPEPPPPQLPRMPFDPTITKEPGALSALLVVPGHISKALMTQNGQRLLLYLMQERGPLLDDVMINMLSAGTRDAVLPAAPPMVGGPPAQGVFPQIPIREPGR